MGIVSLIFSILFAISQLRDNCEHSSERLVMGTPVCLIRDFRETIAV